VTLRVYAVAAIALREIVLWIWHEHRGVGMGTRMAAMGADLTAIVEEQ